MLTTKTHFEQVPVILAKRIARAELEWQKKIGRRRKIETKKLERNVLVANTSKEGAKNYDLSN